jgi:regulator of protease activity HflC (stomatin/prohibitin superfamily)
MMLGCTAPYDVDSAPAPFALFNFLPSVMPPKGAAKKLTKKQIAEQAEQAEQATATADATSAASGFLTGTVSTRGRGGAKATRGRGGRAARGTGGGRAAVTVAESEPEAEDFSEAEVEADADADAEVVEPKAKRVRRTSPVKSAAAASVSQHTRVRQSLRC